MIPESGLHRIKCSWPNKPEHYAHEPRLLSCGHPVCIQCIQTSDTIHTGSTAKTHCVQCGNENTRDLLKSPVDEILQATVENDLKYVYDELCSKICSTENEIENKVKSLYDEVDNKCTFAEEEIEIRIESLKMKLDDICDELKIRLNNSRNIVLKSLSERIEASKPNYEQEQEENHRINKRNGINLKQFNEENKKLLDFGVFLEELNNLSLKVEFIENIESKITVESIGDVCVSTAKHMLNNLDTSNTTYVQLKNPPSRAIQLKNGNILVSSEAERLSLYDPSFKFIKKSTDWHIRCPAAIATDTDGDIYVAENCIYKFDIDLGFIKQSDYDQFHTCGVYSDMCFYDGLIYACKIERKRIAVFSLDLVLVTDKIRICSNPAQIQISNNIACILGKEKDAQNKTCFYRKLSNSQFQLIIKYDTWGPILAHENRFYVYENTGFSVYDTRGMIVDKQTKKFGYVSKSMKNHKTNITTDYSFKCGMSIIDSNLIICLRDENKICRVPMYSV